MAVRLEAPLAVGFVEDPLVASGLWCPLRLGGSKRLLGFRLGFLYEPHVIPRISSIGFGRASPPSGLAGCSAYVFFLRYFSVLCWSASHFEIWA
jgi:hypothetical protein